MFFFPKFQHDNLTLQTFKTLFFQVNKIPSNMSVFFPHTNGVHILNESSQVQKPPVEQPGSNLFRGAPLGAPSRVGGVLDVEKKIVSKGISVRHLNMIV